MALCETIYGKFVDLKCVTEDDAEFTLELRQDPEFAKFLPRIDNTLEEQIDWIKKQREEKGDYFFCVWSKDGRRLGTVGLVDVFDEVPQGGRLALKGNAFENIESYMLTLQYAFYELKVKSIWGFVYLENERAARFNAQFGAVFKEPSQLENGRWIKELIQSRDDFEISMKKLTRMLYRGDIPGELSFKKQLESFFL